MQRHWENFRASAQFQSWVGEHQVDYGMLFSQVQPFVFSPALPTWVGCGLTFSRNDASEINHHHKGELFAAR